MSKTQRIKQIAGFWIVVSLAASVVPWCVFHLALRSACGRTL